MFQRQWCGVVALAIGATFLAEAGTVGGHIFHTPNIFLNPGLSQARYVFNLQALDRQRLASQGAINRTWYAQGIGTLANANPFTNPYMNPYTSSFTPPPYNPLSSIYNPYTSNPYTSSYNGGSSYGSSY